jgi:hypothetical protein
VPAASDPISNTASVSNNPETDPVGGNDSSTTTTLVESPPPPPIPAIPTLSQWGLLALALAALAWRRLGPPAGD